MYQVNFEITDNCNIRCRHCAYSCGPNGKTMDNDSIERTIDHISPRTNYLLISGGEPFSVKSSLRHALQYLQQRKKIVLPNAEVCIETNGFWVKDQESTYRTLKEIHGLGIEQLIIASLDKYHKEQGLDAEKQEFSLTLSEAIDRLAIELGRPKRHLLGRPKRYPITARIVGANNGVIPFGRAKDLPKEEHKETTVCDVPYNFSYGSKNVTIAPDGRAYLCCWKVIPTIGSAVEEPIDLLIERAMKNPVMRALMEKGPKEAAIAKGVFKNKDSWSYHINPCVKCEEIFREPS